jgi:polyhydroxyalkanoate synthase
MVPTVTGTHQTGFPAPWLAGSFNLWNTCLRAPATAWRSRPRAAGHTPSETLRDAGAFRLQRYRRHSPSPFLEPVLLCPSPVSRHPLLDLQPDRSVVRHLLDRGFEVLLVDWIAPTATDQGRGLCDYVRGLLHEAVELALQITTTRRLHLVGHAMGGTLAAMFTAIYPELVQSLTLAAAPIDGAAGDGLLQTWLRAGVLDPDALVDAYGNCPPLFLRAAFRCAQPIDASWNHPASPFAAPRDPDLAGVDPQALQRAQLGTLPVAGATFREFVTQIYLRNALTGNKLRLGGVPVRLGRITNPMLLLTARHDHLVPPAQTLAIARFVASRDLDSHVAETSHTGLAVGLQTHATLWPQATRWLANRSTPLHPD